MDEHWGDIHIVQPGMDGPGQGPGYFPRYSHSPLFLALNGPSNINPGSVLRPISTTPVYGFPRSPCGIGTMLYRQQDSSVLNQVTSNDHPGQMIPNRLWSSGSSRLPPNFYQSPQSSNFPYPSFERSIRLLQSETASLESTPNLSVGPDSPPPTPPAYSMFDDLCETRDFPVDVDAVYSQSHVLKYNKSPLSSPQMQPMRHSTPISKTPYQVGRSKADVSLMRDKNGCITCRVRQKKCSGVEAGQTSCTDCLRLNIQCLGVSHNRPGWLRNPEALKETKYRIKHHLTEYPVPRGRGPTPKRPHLDFYDLIEKYSPRTPGAGESSKPDSLPTTLVLADSCRALPSIRTTENKTIETVLDDGIDWEGAVPCPPISSPESPTSQAWSRPSLVTNASHSNLQYIPSSTNHKSPPLNDAGKPSSLAACSEPPPLSLTPLSNKLAVMPKEDYSSNETYRLAHDRDPSEGCRATSTQLLSKVNFFKGLLALSKMLPSVSPRPYLRWVKSSDVGQLYDGYWIRVEGLNNPLFKDFVGHHFLSPFRANILSVLFQRSSRCRHKFHMVHKHSRLAILGDEQNGVPPMSLESEIIRVVDAPIVILCKIKAYPSAPLPVTVNDLQELSTADKGVITGLDPEPPAQYKRFCAWEIGGCVKYIQEHSPGPGRMEWGPLNKCTIKERHSGLSATVRLDVRGLLCPRQYHPKHRRPTRMKRPEFKSYPIAPPHFQSSHGIQLTGLQSVKGHSANFFGELSSGNVDLLDFSFCLPTFDSFLNGSGSTNGDEIESGQGPGSELLQGLGMDRELLRFIDSTEPGLNIFAPQLQYHEGADLPVQQPPHAPVPPVPLSVNPQFDVRGSEENTTVPALETPAPWSHHGGASNSAVQPSNAPLPENSQCDTHGPDWYDGFATGCLVTRGSGGPINRPQPCTTEWNKGFFYGFMLASRTLGQPSGSQPQPNLNGCSTAAAPTPTVVPNADVESSRTTTGLDYPTAPSPTRPTLQSSIAHAVDDQPQAQPGPSNTQTIARRDTSDGVQITTASTSQELASRVGDASTSSHIGPIRTGSNRNIYRCDTCKKGFPQRQRLDNHVKRDHLGQPNSYTCNFPGCDKSFASEDGLRRHHKKVHSSTQAPQS
ncbi:unnamed protein product [Rhizoctonia solani]|uniref:Zn(2)-C6 fungal-type domain-containing protein n=1 Tax=Rhizoctonia solani TaxID=456999 RepID=A0A8H3A6I2_9AGAM|nr:unnamed protein product [Rhizoctonia solani]